MRSRGRVPGSQPYRSPWFGMCLPYQRQRSEGVYSEFANETLPSRQSTGSTRRSEPDFPLLLLGSSLTPLEQSSLLTPPCPAWCLPQAETCRLVIPFPTTDFLHTSTHRPSFRTSPLSACSKPICKLTRVARRSDDTLRPVARENIVDLSGAEDEG